MGWFIKIGSGAGNTYFFRCGCQCSFTAKVHKASGDGYHLNMDDNILPWDQRSMITYLKLNGRRSSLSRFHTVRYKAHSLIHNGGAHTTVKSSGNISHPWGGFTPERVASTIRIAICQFKLKHISDGIRNYFLQ